MDQTSVLAKNSLVEDDALVNSDVSLVSSGILKNIDPTVGVARLCTMYYSFFPKWEHTPRDMSK
jgi:hypothetical protein